MEVPHWEEGLLAKFFLGIKNTCICLIFFRSLGDSFSLFPFKLVAPCICISVVWVLRKLFGRRGGMMSCE